jgi:hypothetical protein
VPRVEINSRPWGSMFISVNWQSGKWWACLQRCGTPHFVDQDRHSERVEGEMKHARLPSPGAPGGGIWGEGECSLPNQDTPTVCMEGKGGRFRSAALLGKILYRHFAPIALLQDTANGAGTTLAQRESDHRANDHAAQAAK